MRDEVESTSQCVWTLSLDSFFRSYPSTNRWDVKKARADIVQGNKVTPLPYSAYRYSFKPKPADYYTQSGLHVEGLYGMTQPYDFMYTLFQAQSVAPGLKLDLENLLVEAIMNKHMEYGVALGELGESANTLANVIRKIHGVFAIIRSPVRGSGRQARKRAQRRKIRDIKNLTGLSPKGVLDNSLSWWLQYKFAWLPLFSDAYSIMEDIKGLAGETLRLGHTEFAQTTTSLPNKMRPGYTGSVERTYGAKGSVTFRVDDPWLRMLSRRGLTNPLSIAWELFPYSFVVDYFVGIGTFLDGVKGVQGLSFEHGYITTYVQEKGTLERFLHSDGEGQPFGWEIDNFSFERVGTHSFPRTHLRLKVPNFNQALVIGAIALTRR